MPPAPAPAAFARPSAGHALESTIALAIADLGAGRTRAAVRRFRPLRPDAVGSAHASLIGRVLAAAGAHADALGWFDRALAADGHCGDALLNRATVLIALGRTDDAMAAYEAADRVGLCDALGYYNHATLLAQRGDHPAAVGTFAAALRLQPAYPDALRAAAASHKALGRITEALALVDAALRLAPAEVEIWLERANLLRSLDRLVEALGTLDAGLRAAPADPRLLNNRGIVLHDLGRMADALTSLDEVLGLTPNFTQAHHNRGNVLVRLGRLPEAIASFDAALAQDPTHAEALASRGVALKLLGRFDDAMHSLEAALERDPGSIHARANRGELDLLLGQFARGWPDYEYRFFTERQSKPVLKRPVPPWDGQPCPGARLVAFADQGNGDVIQFARFLPALRARGAEVTLLCPARLHRLLRPVTEGIDVQVAAGDDERFDCQIALSSLPGAFQTDLDSLAHARPYLRAEPGLVERWAGRLPPGGLRVGLCWRGSQNWQCDPNRSLPLAAFAPLAEVPGVRLFSLQLPDNTEAGGAVLPIDELGAELDTGPDGFVDTAAAMAHLDCVVTCDTSIAHLAGALGRPAFVLLQAVPEWRWMLGRDTSPWYPSLRLFRQPSPGDWTTPVAAVAAALARC